MAPTEGRVAKHEWRWYRGTARDEVIVFCEQQLQNQQPRDDYRELLRLVLIFCWKKTATGCNLASTWANASSSLDGKGDLQPEDLAVPVPIQTDNSRIPSLA